jgi:hypothetical protein
MEIWTEMPETLSAYTAACSKYKATSLSLEKQPEISFVCGSRPLAYFGLLHELEHVHCSLLCKQDFEVSPVWHFADCEVLSFQLLNHDLSFSAPLSALEQEVRDSLSATAAPPAACIFGSSDPH